MKVRSSECSSDQDGKNMLPDKITERNNNKEELQEKL